MFVTGYRLQASGKSVRLVLIAMFVTGYRSQVTGKSVMFVTIRSYL